MVKHMLGLAMLMAFPAMASAPDALDVTGTWTITADVQGNAVAETCILAQAPDGKITGTCDTSAGGKFDTTGSVTDKTAVFQHAGDYQGTKLVLTYTGKIGSDGMMTGTLDVDPFSATGSFSAKKGAAPAQ